VSVCLLVTIVSPACTEEPIEILVFLGRRLTKVHAGTSDTVTPPEEYDGSICAAAAAILHIATFTINVATTCVHLCQDLSSWNE